MAQALRIAVTFIMTNHLYEFDDKIKRQNSGGAIGLELTGDLAQIYLMWYDTQLKRKIEEKGAHILLYKRYVDDINMVIKVPSTEQQQEDVSLDEEWMVAVKDLGNGIHPSTQLTVDYPSKHEDKKVPILDLKVWLECRNDEDGVRVWHEFYYKEVATKSLTQARSAMATRVKRTTLTQELLRIILRCSPDLRWEEEVVPHLNHCMMRMQYSGYCQQFRAETLRSALKAYEEIKRKDAQGIQPMYRDKRWHMEEREESKRMKKSGWFRKGGFRSVMFIPATPNSRLKKQYEAIIKESKIPIRVVERSGTTVKQKLQRSNPLSTGQCADKENCMVCRTGGKNCRKEGVNYSITCDKCGAVYIGETGRNAYTRGVEHDNDLRNKSKNSVLWRHTSQEHYDDDTPPTYTMRVTAINTNDATMRQVVEGIQIQKISPDVIINNRSEWTAGGGIVGAALTRM